MSPFHPKSTFPNAIKNLALCLLLKISLFHVQYKLQSMSKKAAKKMTRLQLQLLRFH